MSDDRPRTIANRRRAIAYCLAPIWVAVAVAARRHPAGARPGALGERDEGARALAVVAAGAGAVVARVDRGVAEHGVAGDEVHAGVPLRRDRGEEE